MSQGLEIHCVKDLFLSGDFSRPEHKEHRQDNTHGNKQDETETESAAALATEVALSSQLDPFIRTQWRTNCCSLARHLGRHFATSTSSKKPAFVWSPGHCNRPTLPKTTKRSKQNKTSEGNTNAQVMGTLAKPQATLATTQQPLVKVSCTSRSIKHIAMRKMRV